MSHLTQMAALTVQNFLSAATGMAVAVALARGFARRGVGHARQLLGGPHARDALRPAAAVAARAPACSCRRAWCRPLRGAADGGAGRAAGRRAAGHEQVIALGPVASQVAIKQLGTNGGGYFNANSAHPLENPTPLSNLVQLLAILLLPAAFCFAFGRLVGSRRHGWMLFAAMTALLVPLLLVWRRGRTGRQPALDGLGLDQSAGNMEGKEVRFGVPRSALWATVDHGGVERLGELHARQLHAARRAGADVAHAARRGRLRRRRVGTLRHADVRRRRRLHRRADGRAGRPSSWARSSRPTR